jgi:hypothetical protein
LPLFLTIPEVVKCLTDPMPGDRGRLAPGRTSSVLTRVVGGAENGKRYPTRYRTASAVFGALFLTTAATGFPTDVNVAVAIAPAVLSSPYFAVALSVMVREGHHPQVPEGHAQ